MFRDQHPSLAHPAETVPCPHRAAATRAVDTAIPLSDLLARDPVAVAIEVVGVPGWGAYRTVDLVAVYVAARRRRRSAAGAAEAEADAEGDAVSAGVAEALGLTEAPPQPGVPSSIPLPLSAS